MRSLCALLCFYFAALCLLSTGLMAADNKLDGRLSRNKSRRTRNNRQLGNPSTPTSMDNFSGRTLDVTGTADLMLKPDICYLSVTIEKKDKKSALTAHTLNSADTKSLFGKLQDKNIDIKDIATMNMQLNPIYETLQINNKYTQVLEGFSSRQDILIKIRDLTTVSYILDIAASIESVQINNINFTVENPKKFLEEARKQAFQDALSKAQQICSLASVTLGKPITIQEMGSLSVQSPHHHRNNMMMKSSMAFDGAAESGSSGVSQGEVKFTHGVNIKYEILVTIST